jgi:hypothetical protein
MGEIFRFDKVAKDLEIAEQKAKQKEEAKAAKKGKWVYLPRLLKLKGERKGDRVFGTTDKTLYIEGANGQFWRAGKFADGSVGRLYPRAQRKARKMAKLGY